MDSVCVFCGSQVGASQGYQLAARATGEAIARAGLRLVYGGGKVGLMGAIADAALASGGQVIGVIPRTLFDREIAHTSLTELRIVKSMHERKEMMAALSDAFLALPGGAGTLEEIFEQWTWSQLGIHAKPCGFINTDGYFDPLLAMIEHMVSQQFLSRNLADMLLVETDPERILVRCKAYKAPPPRWTSQAATVVKP